MASFVNGTCGERERETGDDDLREREGRDVWYGQRAMMRRDPDSSSLRARICLVWVSFFSVFGLVSIFFLR